VVELGCLSPPPTPKIRERLSQPLRFFFGGADDSDVDSIGSGSLITESLGDVSEDRGAVFGFVLSAWKPTESLAFGAAWASSGFPFSRSMDFAGSRLDFEASRFFNGE
jgi:hypothetical protein